MKIYELAPAPSARRVSIFLAEKGITVDRENVDIRGGENLSESFLAKAVNGRIPVLELDDGTTICESVAICRYFEELYPEKTPLFGGTALEKANVEMWHRVVELEGLFVAFQSFRNITGIYKDRETCSEEWGQISLDRLKAFLPKLEKQLGSNTYIAGEFFSIVDITAYVMFGFAKNLEVVIDDSLPNTQRWFELVSERPSVQ